MNHTLRIAVLLFFLSFGVFSCGSDSLQNFNLLRPDVPNAQTDFANLPGLQIELRTEVFNNTQSQSSLFARLPNENLEQSGYSLQQRLGPQWILEIGNLEFPMTYDQNSDSYLSSDSSLTRSEVDEIESSPIRIVNASTGNNMSSGNSYFISQPTDFSTIVPFNSRTLSRCDASQILWKADSSNFLTEIEIKLTRVDASSAQSTSYAPFSDDGQWLSDRTTGTEPSFDSVFEDNFLESEKLLPVSVGTLEERLERTFSNQSLSVQQGEVFSIRLDLKASRIMQRPIIYEANCP